MTSYRVPVADTTPWRGFRYGRLTWVGDGLFYITRVEPDAIWVRPLRPHERLWRWLKGERT